MSDRKPFLFGGILLAMVVAAVGAFWFLSVDAPAATSDIGGPDSRLAVMTDFEAPVDPAGVPIPLDHPDLIPMTVYLSPTCGCCGQWVEHIADHGFEVELDYRADVATMKVELDVWPEFYSCHTAVVGDYVIEGHVPGEVVRRFLAEAPPVRGLAVPGMPVGSPGMEVGDSVQEYDVLSFTSDGRYAVYSREGRD